MALKDALAKKGGLTLSQLANYDDLATDALVDRVSSFARRRAKVYHKHTDLTPKRRSTSGPLFARIA